MVLLEKIDENISSGSTLSSLIDHASVLDGESLLFFNVLFFEHFFAFFSPNKTFHKGGLNF